MSSDMTNNKLTRFYEIFIGTQIILNIPLYSQISSHIIAVISTLFFAYFNTRVNVKIELQMRHLLPILNLL